MALSDFLNGYTSVSFYHDALYAHIGQHKKSCVALKIVMSTTKKIFHIEVNVTQQNYVRQKNVVVTKQIICTQKKTHVD